MASRRRTQAPRQSRPGVPDGIDTVVTSALCVTPDPDSEPWHRVQELRQAHDRQIKRWPPHINLLYPFVPEPEFPGAKAALESALAKCRPLRIRLAEFGYFTHGKRGATVWLRPDILEADGSPTVKGDNPLEQVFRCSEVATGVVSKHSEFSPHLTIGQVDSAAAAETLVQELKQKWSPVEFAVNELRLIARPKDNGSMPFTFVSDAKIGSE